jgi:hypothetical protein
MRTTTALQTVIANRTFPAPGKRRRLPAHSLR